MYNYLVPVNPIKRPVPVITSQKEEQSYASVKMIQIVSKIQDTLVINYIHEIDGKKNLL